MWETGKPIAQVARDLGINPGTLGNWVDRDRACTLEAGAMPTRLADWDAILAAARHRVALGETGLRVEFGADVDVAELARLVVAEQRCCAFFSFALTVDGRGIGLEIVAPEGAARILADLFGSAS